MKKFDFTAATEKKTDQYAGMVNYKYRINDALMEWTAQQYNNDFNLHHFTTILEIGCGNGEFWKYVVNRQALQSSIVLTDSSSEMLEECKINLSNTRIKPDYSVVDMDCLPYKHGTFNAILAHKVIYHAENPTRALKSVRDTLGPGGVLGMTVLNAGVNQSMWGLAHAINGNIPPVSFTSRFSNIEASKVLPELFAEVVEKKYESTLKITSSDQVMNAVKSNPIVKDLQKKQKISDNDFTLFKKEVDKQIAATGYFESEYDATLYLCRKDK